MHTEYSKNNYTNSSMGNYHRTSGPNQFQFNQKLKRHSLQRVLIKNEGYNSVTDFLKHAQQTNEPSIVDYQSAGATPFDSGIITDTQRLY